MFGGKGILNIIELKQVAVVLLHRQLFIIRKNNGIKENYIIYRMQHHYGLFSVHCYTGGIQSKKRELQIIKLESNLIAYILQMCTNLIISKDMSTMSTWMPIKTTKATKMIANRFDLVGIIYLMVCFSRSFISNFITIFFFKYFITPKLLCGNHNSRLENFTIYRTMKILFCFCHQYSDIIHKHIMHIIKCTYGKVV